VRDGARGPDVDHEAHAGARALWALQATGAPPALVRAPILVGALEDAALAVVAPRSLRALPRRPERLEALWRAPDSPGLADLLVDFDDAAALYRLARIVTATTSADNAARLALRPSKHARATEVCAEIVSALRASGRPNAHVLPCVRLAAELATKHGVVTPKKGRATVAALPALPTATATAPEPAAGRGGRAVC